MHVGWVDAPIPKTHRAALAALIEAHSLEAVADHCRVSPGALARAVAGAAVRGPTRAVLELALDEPMPARDT